MHACIRQILIRCTCDFYIFAWFRYFEFRVVSNGEPEVHCESKKLGHFFTAYNFKNIEQIFTKFGTNQSLFILNIVPEFI